MEKKNAVVSSSDMFHTPVMGTSSLPFAAMELEEVYSTLKLFV